ERLLAHGRVAVRPRLLDEQRDAFVAWELAEGEDRLLLDLGLGVFLDRLRDRGGRGPAGLLAEPEEGLAADVRAPVARRHLDDGVGGLGRARRREREQGVLAELGHGVRADEPA